MKEKYVYLLNIQGTDFYKIGFSKNPEKRVKELQTASPLKIVLICKYLSKRATRIEKILHRINSSKKINEIEGELNGEWFEFPVNFVINFLNECKNIDDRLNFLEESDNYFGRS